MSSASHPTPTEPAAPEGPKAAKPGRLVRRRRLLVLGGVLAAVGVVIAAAQAPLRDTGTVPGGAAAADFTLENLRRGEPPVSLADYRGRPVVLNFFASWCVPCRRELPGLEAVHERVGERVAFVGVNHQDQRGPALGLLDEASVTYPTGFDPDGGVAAAYGLYGMPTTVFISAEGRVVERRTGELSEKALEDTIRRLFS